MFGKGLVLEFCDLKYCDRHQGQLIDEGAASRSVVRLAVQ